MENRKISVAITHGDTNGVGYELIFKTFTEPEMLELCTPIIYGSPKIAAYHRKALDIQANFTIINDAREAHEGKVNLIPCFDDEVKVDLGMPTPESGMAALRALDKAMTDFRDGAFDVLVSCPLSSENIHDDSFSFPGLTKYVETCVGDGAKAMEIMLSEEMRMAVEAAGTNIKDVAAKLSQEGIMASVKTLSASAHRDFGLSNARVAVLSLNAEDGICYIANLPLVCTAPLTDPQYEIAGKGIADEMAFRHAVFAAIDIFRSRAVYDEPMDNPLQKLYHEKRDESERVRFAIPKKHDNGFKPTPRDGRRNDGPREFKPRYNKQQQQEQQNNNAKPADAAKPAEAVKPAEVNAKPNNEAAKPAADAQQNVAAEQQ